MTDLLWDFLRDWWFDLLPGWLQRLILGGAALGIMLIIGALWLWR